MCRPIWAFAHAHFQISFLAIPLKRKQHQRVWYMLNHSLSPLLMMLRSWRYVWLIHSQIKLGIHEWMLTQIWYFRRMVPTVSIPTLPMFVYWQIFPNCLFRYLSLPLAHMCIFIIFFFFLQIATLHSTKAIWLY